jgi:aspartate/methionine/tyrosine aminotransferase
LEGDVLIPAPSWVSYAPQARLAGRRVIPVATDPADWHRLTPRALAAAYGRARHAGADPRILIVNTPSNPTGGMFAQEDVEALAEWARSARVTVVSDEIYAELAHGWRQHVSPARFYPEGTIVTGGLSKAYAAGGWRLGYAAMPAGVGGPSLRSALRALASEIWSAASAPIQEATVAAYGLNAELAAYVRRGARLYAHATGRLHAALLRLGVVCPRPAGGFYLYPDFAPWREALARRGVDTSTDLARLLLDEHDIATLPGVAFGDTPDGLRLRLATSLLFAGEGDVSAAERDARLWSLIERADTLPAEYPGEGEPLPLPALERANERLDSFITALGSPRHP